MPVALDIGRGVLASEMWLLVACAAAPRPLAGLTVSLDLQYAGDDLTSASLSIPGDDPVAPLTISVDGVPFTADPSQRVFTAPNPLPHRDGDVVVSVSDGVSSRAWHGSLLEDHTVTLTQPTWPPNAAVDFVPHPTTAVIVAPRVTLDGVATTLPLQAPDTLGTHKVVLGWSRTLHVEGDPAFDIEIEEQATLDLVVVPAPDRGAAIRDAKAEIMRKSAVLQFLTTPGDRTQERAVPDVFDASGQADLDAALSGVQGVRGDGGQVKQGGATVGGKRE